MNFEVLTEKEFDSFSKNYEQANFFQTVENAKLRESYGSKIHYLGIKEKNKIIAAGMFTETLCMFGKKRFYAPQGFLADYHNQELLAFFTENLKSYAKKHNAMFIKIDPNVIYQVRDVNGKTYPNTKPDDETIENLKKLGYHFFGFTKDYRFTQSRWNFRLSLDTDYEELKKRFSKSTRKNIENMYKKGVRIKRGKEEDLEAMTILLRATAERKNFRYRDLEYYKRMYNYYQDLMHIYIAYVDSNLYLEYAKNQLTLAEENKKVIEEKMKVDMVGSKLKKQLEDAIKTIEKSKKELEEAEQFKKDYPNGKDIGGLLSVKSGKEYITLTSGILAEYKKFMPKYIMYNEHIKDAYELKLPYVNFYGISGTFDEKDPVYGVYEFKKGFSGEVVELVGEFTLKLSMTYSIYNLCRKLKIFYRKITKQ